MSFTGTQWYMLLSVEAKKWEVFRPNNQNKKQQQQQIKIKELLENNGNEGEIEEFTGVNLGTRGMIITVW